EQLLGALAGELLALVGLGEILAHGLRHTNTLGGPGVMRDHFHKIVLGLTGRGHGAPTQPCGYRYRAFPVHQGAVCRPTSCGSRSIAAPEPWPTSTVPWPGDHGAAEE